MTSDGETCDRSMERLKAAIDARRLEIELFWRRSLFFWGFIGASFVALAHSYDAHPRLALAVSCFGLVCSVCWTFANRGSKYWFEAWETKVEREEKGTIGLLFGTQEDRQDKGFWLSARRFSVSKLSVVLSDYVCVLWLAMLVYQLALLFSWVPEWSCAGNRLAGFFVVFSFVFIGMMLYFSRSSLRNWITRRAILRSNGMMPVAISRVLVGFVDKLRSRGKIGQWYTSLKNNDGIPSFRVYLEVNKNDEKEVLSQFQAFLAENREEIGWTGKFFSPHPTFDPSYPHLQQINQACELALQLVKKYPNANRIVDEEFWNEVRTEVSILLKSMDPVHHREFLHFLANNLAIRDKVLKEKLAFVNHT